MAAPTTRQEQKRQKCHLPVCYHEGYLGKKAPSEETYLKWWTCLCGNILFFFNSSKDNEYTEKLALSDFVSLSDDYSRSSSLEAARFSLRMKDGEVKLKASSPEDREKWKGFIYAVVLLKVPTSLNLLPGQINLLREVIEKEKMRQKRPCRETLPPPPTPPVYAPLQADMPACYYPVSRAEGEMLLERNQENGNFILRPGKLGSSLAITAYQNLNRPLFSHYRVVRNPDGGFTIDVDNPIPCATLHDVISYMVEKTCGALRPLIMEETYERNITFVQSNHENGERSLLRASVAPSAVPPVPPPKPALIRFGDYNEEQRFLTGPALPNSVPPVPPPKPGSELAYDSDSSQDSCFDEVMYTNYPRITDDSFRAPSPLTPQIPVKKALLPKSPSVLSSSSTAEQSSSTSVKKALLPKQTSVPSFQSSRGSDAQDSGASGKVAPLPRNSSFLAASYFSGKYQSSDDAELLSVKSSTLGKKRSSLPEDRAVALSEELKARFALLKGADGSSGVSSLSLKSSEHKMANHR